ncbi:hypothetical protein [Ammonifex thiophilus]|uniref:Uncharacterized protein n=1 Tax=Ammonifex thiophilus TaxID=444093 RepID=A0A3D8P5Y4_9THEO|nr:hypothetical protein [Ammonifex thiophilus]RDV83927.1 hypothetical protein DXX99_03575 [Ammonifex thiophilus]
MKLLPGYWLSEPKVYRATRECNGEVVAITNPDAVLVLDEDPPERLMVIGQGTVVAVAPCRVKVFGNGMLVCAEGEGVRLEVDGKAVVHAENGAEVLVKGPEVKVRGLNARVSVLEK